MADLSVGQVSGLIAAAVFLLQVLLPLLIPLILVAFLTNRNPLVSWSVLGRFLHSSLWPSILNTDTAARHGVQRRITYSMWLQTGALGLISLASVMTPLGLYDVVEPQSPASLEPFRFIVDTSAFGNGTPPRTSAPFTRSCGSNAACPGMTINKTCIQKGLAQVCNGTTIDRAIPAPLVNLFRDGPDQLATSVSGIFDIQWRSYLNATDAFGSVGWYIRSSYRQMAMLIPQPKIHVVDGLIVDTEDGGVGFRRHSVPAPLHEYGSKWTEDILFIEPETQCVDTNITFDFSLSLDDAAEPRVKNLALIDHGGFSNLSRTMPTPGTRPNGQSELNVGQRAYYAAWMSNFLTMAFFNLTDRDPENFTRNDARPGLISRTNSTTVKLQPSDGNNTFAIEYQSLRSSGTYGEYLANLPAIPSDQNKTSEDNPFAISKQDFNSIVLACTGSTINDLPNVNSSLVGCGLVYGAARRTDNGSNLIPDAESKWSVPLYSCASSFRAIVKTATFRFNGTTIDGLQVMRLEPKNYTGSADLPQWAVENIRDATITNMQPLWGIIGTSNASVPTELRANVSTLTQESLRLPGVSNLYSLIQSPVQFDSSRSGQYLPGVDFYTQALYNAYNIARPGRAGYSGFGDYSGRTSLALYSKWRELSSSAAKAAGIINLVWTDVAANAVVGAKGWVPCQTAQKRDTGSGNNNSNNNNNNKVPITVYRKKVQYKILFAIPAFIAIAATLAVISVAVSLSVMRRTGAGKLRQFLDTMSTGRAIGTFLWPETGTNLKTDAWVEAIGKRQVIASEDGGFTADDDDSEPENNGVGETREPKPSEKARVAVQNRLLDGR